jgi:hypothetical protein
MAATKLGANADRCADRATFSRDVIDLAMMKPSPKHPSRTHHARTRTVRFS